MKKYQIYNGFNSNLLADYPVVEAKTGADAVRFFLKKTGITFTKIKRSAGRNVIISATPFFERDGRNYKNGVVSWFEVWNGENIYH
jgi:hypothetical protein